MILLDTHAWVWWAAEPEKLSPRARQLIAESAELGVSAISCWEVAMLVAKRRLELDRDVLQWLRQALALPQCTLLPLTPEIAVASSRLPAGFQGDPADRIIVATGLHHRSPLMSKDKRILSFKPANGVW